MNVYDKNDDYWLRKDFLSEPFRHLLADKIKPGSRILDLGCGGGRLSLTLSGIASYTCGVDNAPNLISRLQSEHPEVDWRCGNAELLDFWQELPQFDYIVSNVCIRKDQCRLEKLIIALLDTQEFVPKLLFRIQGADDLPGYVQKNPCYSSNEILACLRPVWNCEIQIENYQQRFTSGDYLRESVERIGLIPTAKAAGNKKLQASRQYILLYGEPNHGRTTS